MLNVCEAQSVPDVLRSVPWGVGAPVDVALEEGRDVLGGGRLFTSIARIDRFLGGLPPGSVTLMEGARGFCNSLVARMMVQGVVSLQSEVLFIDGGNSFDPYGVALSCRRIRRSPREVLSSIRVSRAVTAYQMGTLMATSVPGAVASGGVGVVVVSSLPDLFLDSEVMWEEARTILERCLMTIRSLAHREGPVVLMTAVGRQRSVYWRPLRRIILDFVDSTIQLWEPSRNKLRIQRGDRSLDFYPVADGQLTLDDFIPMAPYGGEEGET